MVIALLTDFGDYYPGVMKGVIRKVSSAEIVDITHSVKPQNVVEGAFLLYSAYKFFPEGSVFVAIVDPGVGGERKPIAIKTKNYWFVCPDNGIAFPSAFEDGIEGTFIIKNEISEISGKLSSTFHGRDVFAPAGALIKEGMMDYFEPFEGEIVKMKLFDATISESSIDARVVHIDRFGNVVTNLKKEQIEEAGVSKVVFENLEIPVVDKYEDVELGEPLALIGSFETLELSIREGSFADKFKVNFGRLNMRWE